MLWLLPTGVRDCTAASFTCAYEGAATDAVSIGKEGFDASYFIPQYAFSTVGTHYTTGGLTSGVLTVNLVRKAQNAPVPQPAPDPGEDPEPVPEPSTWLLSAAGVAVILIRRTGRQTRSGTRKDIAR